MKSIFTLTSFLFFSFLQAQNVSLTWAKSIGGGSSFKSGNSVAIDDSGNDTFMVQLILIPTLQLRLI